MEKVAEVDAVLALAKVTVPGPLTTLQVTVGVPTELVAVATSTRESVMLGKPTAFVPGEVIEIVGPVLTVRTAPLLVALP